MISLKLNRFPFWITLPVKSFNCILLILTVLPNNRGNETRTFNLSKYKKRSLPFSSFTSSPITATFPVRKLIRTCLIVALRWHSSSLCFSAYARTMGPAKIPASKMMPTRTPSTINNIFSHFFIGYRITVFKLKSRLAI